MDIFILLLIALLFILIPYKNIDFLEKENTNSLRGLLVFGIIFTHIAAKVNSGYHFANFRYIGTYLVAVYFFLSGYALYFQFENKEDYLNGFLRKRFLKILIPYFWVNLLYLLVYFWLWRNEINLEYFKNLIIKGGTLVSHSWFIIVILAFYLIFYFAYSKFERNKALMFITFSCMFLMLLFYKIGYQNYWGNNLFAFPFGIWFCMNREKIERILFSKYNQLIFFSVILLFVTHHYPIYFQNFYQLNNLFDFVAGNIDGLVFTVFFLLVMVKLDFRNRWLKQFNSISLYLYMTHGLIISILTNFVPISQKSDLLFSALTLMGTVLISYALKKLIDENLLRIFKK
jgi:putative acyltransferase